MASFTIQSDYASQGDLSQDYAGWLANQLKASADVIAWHLATHQGWEVEDALLVKDALIAGAFDLSDLFTAANLNAKKVDELGGGFDPDTHFELDGSVPSISFTGQFGDLNDLLDPDTGNGPIDLSAFLDKADTTYWTNDTAKGENYHFRGMFTGFVDDQDGYEEGWNDQDGPELNYFTFNFGETLTIVDSEGETIPEGTGGDYLNQTTDEDFNGESHEDQADSGDPEVLQSNNINNQTVTTLDGDGGDPGGDGKVAYVITEPSHYDGIKIISGGEEDSHNMLIGGAGGDGQDGGDGGDITITANNNAQNFTLTTGGGGTGGNGGSGNHAIYNEGLETVIIEGNQDLTVLGGPAGGGGDGGDGGDITVTAGQNADGTATSGEGGEGGAGGDGGEGGGEVGDGGDDGTVTVKGDQLNEPDAGESGESGGFVAAFSHLVDVDATAFTGYLTISGSDDHDTMWFGTGGTTVYGTQGDDIYWFNDAATDTIIYTDPEQSAGSDTINNFDLDNDKIDISALVVESVWSWNWNDEDETLEINLNGDADYEMAIVLSGHSGADNSSFDDIWV